MLRYGTITEVTPGEATARVKFDDSGVVSPPLRAIFWGTKANKNYFPFETEQSVACIMDAHCEDGVILGGIYTEEDAPDAIANATSESKLYKDGTKIIYDWSAHKLTIDGGTNVLVEVKAKQVTVDASTSGMQITGDVKITGKFETTGDTKLGAKLEVVSDAKLDAKLDVTGKGTFSDEIAATGKIASSAEVEVGPIKLTLHKHTAPSGGGPTSPSIP